MYISQCVEKKFKFVVFTFPENGLSLVISTHAPFSYSELQAEFFENLLPLTTERSGEDYDLVYQNSIRKYEDGLEH